MAHPTVPMQDGRPGQLRRHPGRAFNAVTTFFTGSRASLRSAEPSAPRVLAALRAASPAGSTWSTRGAAHEPWSSLGVRGRRPDHRGSARRAPASRALRVATRWTPSTPDPGPRRATWLVIGSPLSPWPGANAGTNARQNEATPAAKRDQSTLRSVLGWLSPRAR